MNNFTKKIVAITIGLAMIVMMTPKVHALTAAELQVLINDLLAQITELQVQLAELEGEAVTVTCDFTRNLYPGVTRGDDVKCLQEYLNAAGHTLADTGAGSPGNETTYFGSLTRAAVKEWQDANGVVYGDYWGYFGPLSQAKYVEVAGVPAEEEEEEEEEEEVAAPLSIGLAIDTPEAAQVALNAQDVIFTKVKIGGGTTDITITKIVVSRGGVSRDQDLSSIKLYDGVTRLGSAQALSSLTHKATFSSLSWVIPAGETKYLTIKGSIAAEGVAYTGDSIKLGIALASDITSTVAFEGTFPIWGKARTTAGISVGTLDVTKQTTPAEAYLLSGAVDQSIASWRFNASNTEGFAVHSIKITHVGSATRDDVMNIKLKVGGVQIGETVESLDASNAATFDLSASPLTINKGSSKAVYAYADIASGIWTDRKVQFEITQYLDVVAYGDNSGGAVTITCVAATVAWSDFVRQTGQEMTISQGTLTIAVDAAQNPSEQEYVVGTENRLFTALKFTTGSKEGARITELKLKLGGTGTAVDISNVTLWDGTTQIAGPASVIGSYVTFGVNTIGWDTTGVVDIPASTVKTLLVKADIPAGATVNNKMELYIAAAGDLKADGLDSRYDIASGDIDISGAYSTATKQHTITEKGTLVISLSAFTPAAQAYVLGSTQKEFTRINLTAGSGEDIVVSSIAVRIYATGTDGTGYQPASTTAHLTNMKLLRSDGTPYGSTISTPLALAEFSGSLIVKASETESLKLIADVPVSDYPDYAHVDIPDIAGALVEDELTSTGVSSSGDIVEEGSATGKLMTLEGGSLNVYAASTPGDQEIIKGAIKVPFLGLVLKAGIAESMRLTSIRLTQSADSLDHGSTTDVSAIALYEGATKLTVTKNLTEVAAHQNYVSFSASDFLNSLGIDIGKGQQKTILVKADIPSTAGTGHTFALGVSTTAHLTCSGLSSNTSPDSVLNIGPVSYLDGVNYNNSATSTTYQVKIAGYGALSVVETAADTPIEAIQSVGPQGIGSSNVVLTKIKFTADSREAIDIKSIAIERSSGRDEDFSTISLWDGTTQLGSVQTLVAASTTFAFSAEDYWRISAGATKYLTIKGDLLGIKAQYGYGALTGDDPKLCLDSITAEGVSSGVTTLGGTYDQCGKNQYLRQSKPTLAAASLPSTVLTAGEKVLYRWTVTADSKGEIGWKKVIIRMTGAVTVGTNAVVGCYVGHTACTNKTDGVYVSTSTAATVVPLIATSSMKIYDVSTGEKIDATTTDTDWTVTNVGGAARIKFVALDEQVVAAGATKTYELRGDILLGGSSGDAIMAKIADVYLTASTTDYFEVALSNGTFIWTDRSGASLGAHTTASADWTHEYKVSGIPTATLSLSK